ncbi:MAG: cation-translocating P-type ATPase [Candidatus Zixiibacteriota bacterium]
MSIPQDGRAENATATLFVSNMDCNDEVVLVEQALKRLPGVTKWQPNLMTREVAVSFDPTEVTMEQITSAVCAAGLKASVRQSERVVESKRSWWTPQLVALALSSLFVIIGFGLEFFGTPHTAVQVFFGAAIIIGAYFPAKMGILALRTLTINIRLLMVVGAAGAVALGLWEEAALLVAIYSLGDVLEAYAVDRARGAVRALMELVPKEALVRRNGTEQVLPIDQVRVDDTVIIRPGEKIPIDGVVSTGESYVDTSAITGEPVPAHLTVGGEVYAGTINQKGSLEIRVTKLAADTTLARIIHAVEVAQTRKSTYQRFAERFGRTYTPAMFALAVAVALVPPLVFHAPWNEYIYRGLVVLVVSCSCGLALAVPVSVIAAIATAARRGVLFKGGAHVEAAANLRAIAFDKTGTLTHGRPEVTDLKTFNGLSERDILIIAASIESRSEHPLGEAIANKARVDGLTLILGVNDFRSITGQGVAARLNGTTYRIGTERLLNTNSVHLSPEQVAVVEQLREEGKTVVLLSDEDKLLGAIAIADRLRPQAKETVNALKAAGLSVIMLTGDNRHTAQAIAGQAGIEEYYAELLPEQKVEKVGQIGERYGAVGMVGDGINDAPALASAAVGIAMGGRGTDIAKETGDVVLMSDDLTKIQLVVDLSKRAVRNMRQNTVASLAIVIFLVPAALMGWIGLVPGLLLNEVSALLVIANALRLLR